MYSVAPLGVNIVGLEDMLAPSAIACLDEAKHAQGVDVVAQREAISVHHGLGGLDMGSGGLLGEEISEQQLAAEVINGSNQSPFLLGKRRP